MVLQLVLIADRDLSATDSRKENRLSHAWGPCCVHPTSPAGLTRQQVLEQRARSQTGRQKGTSDPTGLDVCQDDGLVSLVSAVA